MRMVFRTGVALLLACTAPVVATAASPQVSTPPQPAPAPQAPPAAPQQPSAPPAQPGAIPAPVVPTAPVVARSFTAPTGVIFNVVRPERVVDFELVIGYLQEALAKSTNPQVQAQAKGWHVYKAAEPGPNGTVLYVFHLDPVVPGADYALGPILSDAYPDQIEQIWKLYQGALAGGGSLLNLTTVKPPPLPPPGTAPVSAPTPTVRPTPPPVTPVQPSENVAPGAGAPKP